jgi:hypothetical protein
MRLTFDTDPGHVACEYDGNLGAECSNRFRGIGLPSRKVIICAIKRSN